MRDIEEKERRRELKKRQKRKAREISEKRRPRNREYTLVSCFFVLIVVSMIGYLIYFNYAKSDDFINSPYNTRQDTFSDRVVRGKIISADGQVLAQTNVYVLIPMQICSLMQSDMTLMEKADWNQRRTSSF